MPALYTSLRMETAWLEAQQGLAFKAQPMTMCAYRVACDDILDLRDPATLAAWHISQADLSCAWEDLANRKQKVPSWDVTRRLLADGVAGIIAPSFAHRAGQTDANAVFWTWANVQPHQVAIIDDFNRLPQDDRSWR
jgi:RES domain-containing protein